MSHPARAPVGTTGIDGKANAFGRRQQSILIAAGLTEGGPASLDQR